MMQAKTTTIAVTAAALAVLGTAPAFAAERASKQEAVGLGLGAAVGAAAGGPAGFIVGAAVGAKLGDGFHRKNVHIETLDGELEASRGEVSRLETLTAAQDARIEAMRDELQRMEAHAGPDSTALLEAGIAMDLLFRTAQDELPEETRERLGQLAEVLAGMPGVSVRLDGWADPRGDAAYNEDLSARRAEFVRGVLKAHGVAPERIDLRAHGEAPVDDETPDGYALQRKVSLTLYKTDVATVAANPEQ